MRQIFIRPLPVLPVVGILFTNDKMNKIKKLNGCAEIASRIDLFRFFNNRFLLQFTKFYFLKIPGKQMDDGQGNEVGEPTNGK